MDHETIECDRCGDDASFRHRGENLCPNCYERTFNEEQPSE